MEDTNSAIHQYQIRSCIKPDIKHLPKTLLSALKDKDLPMTSEELNVVNDNMSKRKMQGLNIRKHPPSVVSLTKENTVPNKSLSQVSSVRASTAGNRLADAFNNQNPLLQEADGQPMPMSVNLKGQSQKGCRKSGLSGWSTWIVITIIVVLIAAVVGGCVCALKN